MESTPFSRLLKSSKLLLVIDGVGPSSNEWYTGLHWGKRKKVADYWHEKVLSAAKSCKTLPIKNQVILFVILYVKKGRQLRDSTNCGLSAKLVEDGLVRAGILQDDNPEFVVSVVLACFRSKNKCDYTELRYINER